jgi:nucleoside-diphosphate-sugar epimerase
MGPAFIGAGFSSGEIVSKFMEGEYPGVPKVMISLVDVRDVAEAHLQAIKKPEAANKRFVLVSDSVWFQRVAIALYDEFHPQGYNFSTKELQKCLLTVGAWFKPELKSILKSIGVVTTYDNT